MATATVHETFFECHGVDAHVQDQVAGQEIGRYGWGTVLRQPVGTDNWVHFPVTIQHSNATSPQYVPDLCTYELDCTVNEGAAVRALHVWQGRERMFVTDLALEGAHGGVRQHFQQAIEPRRKVREGLDVAVFVEFPLGRARGEVTFHSVGLCLMLVVSS